MTADDERPLLRRSNPAAGISVTTIDELCTGFNWISILDSMLALRVVVDVDEELVDIIDVVLVSVDDVLRDDDCCSSLTGDGIS